MADLLLGYQSTLLDTDIAVARQVFDVNFFGLLDVTQAFTPLLMKSQGTVVNIGSVVGRVPVPLEGIYNASKAALEALSRQLRVELAGFDIKVVHVRAPRRLDTIGRHIDSPHRSLLEASRPSSLHTRKSRSFLNRRLITQPGVC
jgi:short-subunit dehydrogenase